MEAGVTVLYDTHYIGMEMDGQRTAGVRESRRIVGEYTLTVDDLLRGARFEDGVCNCTFNIDIHSADSEKQDCRVPQSPQLLFSAPKTDLPWMPAQMSYFFARLRYCVGVICIFL